MNGKSYVLLFGQDDICHLYLYRIEEINYSNKEEMYLELQLLFSREGHYSPFVAVLEKTEKTLESIYKDNDLFCNFNFIVGSRVIFDQWAAICLEINDRIQNNTPLPYPIERSFEHLPW